MYIITQAAEPVRRVSGQACIDLEPAVCAASERVSLRRYQLPIVVIVFNNGGIYGGDRRQPALQEAARAGAAKGSFSADPVPTAFVANARCARAVLLVSSWGKAWLVVAAARCPLCMLQCLCVLSGSSRTLHPLPDVIHSRTQAASEGLHTPVLAHHAI